MTRALPPMLAVALALPGCATIAAPTGGLTAPNPVDGMTCEATESQQFVGRKATESIGRSVLRMSGARSLRWGGPDTAFTMDFRNDRVNVIYDARGAITRIYCG